MELRLESYRVKDTSHIMTPALLIYPEIVDANIRAGIRMAGDDAGRWRPHLKTVKSADIVSRLINSGITNFKCATTLELLMACEAGAGDVLVAFPVVSANAERISEIAEGHPRTSVSVLIESAGQLKQWRGTRIGIFVDINPGMNRTGIPQERLPEIAVLAKAAGRQFRGLHYYDGQMSSIAATERESHAHAGYAQVVQIVRSLEEAGVRVQEVITSGTPAAPHAISYPGFRDATFIHRISPGTIVFNDSTSLEQLAGLGFAPAAIVMATVVSQPGPGLITCDAGHKSVSADAGVPTCAVIGHPGLTPLKPSEEHLPIQINEAGQTPQIGDKLYLLPKHVCPTVNNFDEALLVRDACVQSLMRINARGHESPLAKGVPVSG